MVIQQSGRVDYWVSFRRTICVTEKGKATDHQSCYSCRWRIVSFGQCQVVIVLPEEQSVMDMHTQLTSKHTRNRRDS